MELLLINLFSTLMIVSALLVISLNNPVHSVISLVFVFVNASALFFLFGLEYLALVLIVVYVGAIAVLFLFVVMMLNIRRIPAFHFGSLGLTLSLFLLGLFMMDFSVLMRDLWSFIFSKDVVDKRAYADWVSSLSYVTDIELIGQVLFTYYYVYVFLAALILLAAMIGAIGLTMVHSSFVKRQLVYQQVARGVSDSIVLKVVK